MQVQNLGHLLEVRRELIGQPLGLVGQFLDLRGQLLLKLRSPFKPVALDGGHIPDLLAGCVVGKHFLWSLAASGLESPSNVRGSRWESWSRLSSH